MTQTEWDTAIGTADSDSAYMFIRVFSRIYGRVFHSYTSQLHLSRFCPLNNLTTQNVIHTHAKPTPNARQPTQRVT